MTRGYPEAGPRGDPNREATVDDRNYITKNGLERIQRELAWLQRYERPRVTREVTAAAALGDRSENAEYIYGKKRLREIDRRMRHLMARLSKVHPVDPASIRGDVVRFGATVVIGDEQGNERTWRIYGEDEVDVEGGILSYRSPLGQALLGRSEGDTVRFHAPGGTREIEIVEVRYEAQPVLVTPEFDVPD
jgi:transcription elongation factor GreB